MTLLELDKLTLVLEKVCFYEYLEQKNDNSSIKRLNIVLDNGESREVEGRGNVTAFVKAMRDLASK